MDNQIINCRCGRERRNKESNLSGLSIKFINILQYPNTNTLTFAGLLLMSNSSDSLICS